MPTESTTSTKTPITMTDGRVVEFNAKQKLSKESQIADDGTITGRFDFRNGQTRTFTIPAAMIARFAAHGMEQKLGDVIAGEADLDDGVLAMDDLIDRLGKGDWTATRAAGSNTGASILLKALIEVTGKDVETLKTWLAAKTHPEKLALRKSAQLAPVIARLESEKASKSKAPTVDTEALFGELDAAAPVAEVTKPSKAKTGA